MKQMSINEKYCSVAEAAAILGCTTAHIRLLLKNDVLVGEKLGLRTWAVDRRSIDKYAGQEITMGRPRKYSA
jgi:hypothetical protein